ncbi:MAG: glycerate kinase [Lachnospiraceae bacterium]|nr:glycerate kinase [Lachnospiraceae bacterium]
MKKCIVIPDSFKGTLSAIEICNISKARIQEHFPDCEIIAIPVADGGEGTVECFLYSTNAEKVIVNTTGPYGEELQVYYAKCGTQAIIEMASVAGLPLVEENPNPCKTTTYGLGKVILDALDKGCTEIVLGLGGSCTNDAGVGVASALGTKFYDLEGSEFVPAPNEFTKIGHIDNQATQMLLKDIKMTAMCDIDNPMYGQKGAAYIFAPQKGADEKMVKELDVNLQSLATVIETSLQKKVANIPGAGAAGAMGAGIVAFFNGTLKSGIETILDLLMFDKLLENTDMVFTGEGRIDIQSLSGKVVIGVAKRAKQQRIPVTAVVGSIGEGAELAYDVGVTSIFSINRQAMEFSKSRALSDENLSKTMDSLLRFYKSIEVQK